MSNWLRYIRGVVVLCALTGVAGCGDDDGLGPEDDRLSGVYMLSDWLYVFGGDTLELTEDSYIRIRFIDDEHIKGEGFVSLRVPVEERDGDVGYEREPILSKRNAAGETVAVSLEGWYYLSRAEGMDTLRFRLAKGAGAGTWVESFDWLLADDWDSYRIDVRSAWETLRIIHRRR